MENGRADEARDTVVVVVVYGIVVVVVVLSGWIS